MKKSVLVFFVLLTVLLSLSALCLEAACYEPVLGGDVPPLAGDQPAHQPGEAPEPKPEPQEPEPPQEQWQPPVVESSAGEETSDTPSGDVVKPSAPSDPAAPQGVSAWLFVGIGAGLVVLVAVGFAVAAFLRKRGENRSYRF